MSGKEGYPYSQAILKYIMISCPEYQSEFASSNQVYTPIVSIPSYVMFCNAIVNTVEELNGKRLRISGASWARWAKNFGRLSVAIPIHEVYEVLEQGFVDCTFLSPANLAYGVSEADLDDIRNVDVSNEGEQNTSLYLNYLWSPIESVDYGIEVSHHTRELVGGREGKATRLQAMAKYTF